MDDRRGEENDGGWLEATFEVVVTVIEFCGELLSLLG